MKPSSSFGFIYRTFLQHPHENHMTYLSHAKHSLLFSAKLAKASIQAFSHAFFPSTFKDSTSKLTESLVEQLKK
jgi:hypothetical protein